MEGLENHYLELPDVDIDQIIIDNEVIHAIYVMLSFCRYA